jgi:biopolymer transport protein ExbB
MKTASKSTSPTLGDSLKSSSTMIIIIAEIIIAALIYKFVLGNPDNFVQGNTDNHPIDGNMFGTIYQGGIIVPILISLLLMVITFAIERLITISVASGKGNTQGFIRRIKSLVESGNLDQAIGECDKQKGSVANVVKAGLHKYAELTKNTSIDVDKRIGLIQKDIEETTQLEMPMLQKNLVIIATIASIATLMGLLGTVLGMIKSFSALATAGAPDSIKLASGISGALINTALGIGTSALAIILYNFFTSRIDELTYGIDEAGFSIVQNFTAQAKV